MRVGTVQKHFERSSAYSARPCRLSATEQSQRWRFAGVSVGTGPDRSFVGLQRALIVAARSIACAILDHTAFLSLPPLSAEPAPDSLRPFLGLELIMSKRAKPIRPPPAVSRPKNKLLACLPRGDYERLRPHLKTILLKPKQVLHSANEPVRHVFFLNGGVASMTTVMKNGAMVEIATVGAEGFLGINAVFGSEMLSGETMLQVPVPDATAEVMSAEIFKRELGRAGPFQECVQKYSQGLLMLMMQSTGCMALHSTDIVKT